MSRRLLLVVNRKARLGESAHAEVVRLLAAHGLEVVDGTPDHGQRVCDRIRELGESVDVVVIGGGDGTLNAAASALVDLGKPFAILPLGTANDLARTLNLPNDLPAACAVIAAGHTRRIDLGRVNDKLFFNAASVGLSVSITHGLSEERKARFGVFAYLIAAVEAVWKWRPFHADITVDGLTYRVKTVQVTVGNGRHYGGGLTVSADAAIDDQRLDVLSLEVRGWWELVPLFPALLRGTLTGSPRVRVFHGERVEVVTRKPKRVNTDGELTTSTPARFDLLPRALEVVVPLTAAAETRPPSLPTEQLVQRGTPLRRILGWVGRHELLAVSGVAVAVLAFLVIATVVSGGSPAFDESVLRGLRSVDDPTVPVGPRWVRVVMRDLTALGGYTVPTALTIGVIGYLCLRRRWSSAVLVLVSAVGGAAVSDVLKGVFDRERPTVVPHLDEVSTPSFPSSHAALAAAVYLSIALLLSGAITHPVMRAYLLLWAVLLTALVGVSRVYLGVHYPTDVLGGWSVGAGWAILCGLVARALKRATSTNSV